MSYWKTYLEYLEKEKEMAKTSLIAYASDASEFSMYLKDKRNKDVQAAGNADVVAFLLFLKSEDKSGSTINRKLASVRSLYHFLLREKLVTEDPMFLAIEKYNLWQSKIQLPVPT